MKEQQRVQKVRRSDAIFGGRGEVTIVMFVCSYIFMNCTYKSCSPTLRAITARQEKRDKQLMRLSDVSGWQHFQFRVLDGGRESHNNSPPT